MSYTDVIDAKETARTLENVVNRLQRHCRIGKVRSKFPPLAIRALSRVPKPSKQQWIFGDTDQQKVQGK